MAVHQLVMTFRHPAGYGWTERHWIDWGTDQTVLDAVVVQLVQLRNSVLSNDCSLDYIRVSSGQYRNPIIYDGNPNNPGTPTGTSPGPVSSDFERLLIRWRGNNGYGNTFLGGIPSAMVVGDNFTPTPAYVKQLNAYIDFFTNSVWYVESTISSGPQPIHTATTLTPTSPRGYSFSCDAGLVTVGNTIRMKQTTVPGYSGLKVVNRVVTVGGASTVFVGGAMPPALEPITSVPVFTIEGYADVLITQGTWERITRRNAGRPFGQRRGRRANTVPLRR